MCDAMSQRGHYTHQGNFLKEFVCPGIWARALTLCPCPAPLAGCRGWLGLALPRHIHVGSDLAHSQPTHGILTRQCLRGLTG